LGLLALVVVGVQAQPHSNGYVGGSSSGRMIFFDNAGSNSSISVGTSTCYGVIMGPRNQVLLATNLDGNIYRVDPATKTVLGTFASIASPYDIAVGCHGDVFVATSSSIFKIDQASAITTVVSGQASITGGMTIDPGTSDILVQSRSGTDEVLRVTRDGSSVTTIGGGMDARYGMDYHIPTDSIFSGSCCGDFSPADAVYRLPMSSTTATIFFGSATPPVGVYSLKVDRASSAVQQLILGAFAPSSTARGPGGIYKLDVATKAVTLFSSLPAGASLYETEVLYSRNVYTVRTAKGTWDVGISIPEDAGRLFVLATSISGIRPGVLNLPGSRTAYLNPDQVTFAGLTFGLAPFLTGASGTLGTSGNAVAKLDLNLIGSGANGLRLYFLALTLDSSAPGGIQTITDPTVLQVEGL
jgi:hypothetical protein